MDVQLKQRVVGAAVLVALAVIFVPVLLDDGRRHEPAPLPPPAAVVSDPAHARPPDAPPSAALEDIERGMTATPEELARMPAETRVPMEPEVAPGEVTLRPKPEDAKAAPAKKVDSGAPQARKPAGPARSAEQWIVQIGIYANEANATALQSKLKQAGIVTSVANPQEAGKPYRLQAGPLATRESAETLRKRLEKEFDLKGLVKRQP